MYENLLSRVLHCGHCHSLLVRPSLLPDSRAEFLSLRGRDVCVANLELFCRRPDYFLGDFSDMVAPRCARKEDHRVVARPCFKPGGGIVACAAALPAETSGRLDGHQPAAPEQAAGLAIQVGERLLFFGLGLDQM